MNKEIMITTVDNPYDPFEQWDQWLLFDTRSGYHTNNRLAKVSIISEQLSEQEVYDTVERGIEELIRFGAIDKEGNIVEYKKVIKETTKWNKQTNETNEWNKQNN